MRMRTILDGGRSVLVGVRQKRRTMRSLAKLLTGVAMVVLMDVAASAGDWDYSKMHYPQLPNPNGWDVKLEKYDKILADDFRCTESGPITGIHFWLSWQGDKFGTINSIDVGIYSNNPSGPSGWSQPDQMLWTMHLDRIHAAMYAGPTGIGDEGWFNPNGSGPGEGTYALHDHDYYQRYDLLPENPFMQLAGMTYWLVLNIDSIPTPPSMDPVQVGWKTSGSTQWGDAAVWASSPVGGPTGPWIMLADPTTFEPLDLAFVITGGVPEPSTLVLLGMAALALAGYVWRQRKAGR
jgi:hypothetical protein